MDIIKHKTPMNTDLPPVVARGRISLLHVTIICLSLAMTVGAWQLSKAQIEARIEGRFNAARDRALGLITERMKKYEDALWAGVATIKSHGDKVSRDQWRVFAGTLQIEEKYPGINGIGVIHFLSESSRNAYLEERRTENPAFKIHPAHSEGLFMPISFIEPENKNAAAVGLDVAHELNRRTAALASRDSGLAQITGPIILVQDASSTAGFLFYAPYYRGDPPGSVAERQDRIGGAVYAPFVVRELMEGLLAKELRNVRFSIRDDEKLIYDEHLHEDASYDPDPMFADQVDLELYGRTWSIDMRSNLSFRNENTYSQPTIILVAGLVIETLVIALLVLMSRANGRAVAYAEKVTAALRRQTEELKKTNEELEQFAYITSHDLKTPIRGIGGLTEMLLEDLEQYLSSPNANPDVELNLNRILDRVGRMNDLTRAVLDFSGIESHETKEAGLILSEATDALVSDFGLRPDQLELIGDVKIVNFDAFNLRRILENLVGNAVKYHNCVENLKIKVSAETNGNCYKVSVQDNGPGIEPRFHDRIFNVFQTLRAGNSPESTGIGLAIVKKSVERHGGKINLVSSPGEGATFFFDWPKTTRIGTNLESERAA